MTPEEAITFVAKFLPKRPMSQRPRNERIAFWAGVKAGDTPFGRDKAIKVIDNMDADELDVIRRGQEALQVLREAIKS